MIESTYCCKAEVTMASTYSTRNPITMGTVVLQPRIEISDVGQISTRWTNDLVELTVMTLGKNKSLVPPCTVHCWEFKASILYTTSTYTTAIFINLTKSRPHDGRTNKALRKSSTGIVICWITVLACNSNWPIVVS